MVSDKDDSSEEEDTYEEIKDEVWEVYTDDDDSDDEDY